MELKPCPFCGGPAEINDEYPGNAIARCKDQSCFGHVTDWVLDRDGDGYQSVEKAAEAWNKRAPTTN